ncbi:uncharacterized protein METZ01_LOCUS35433, partial [marine metagenome]
VSGDISPNSQKDATNSYHRPRAYPVDQLADDRGEGVHPDNVE